MRIRRGYNQCKIVSLWSQAIAQKAGTTQPSTPTPATPTTPTGGLCKTKPEAGTVRYGVCQDVTSCLDIKGTPTRGLCAGQFLHCTVLTSSCSVPGSSLFLLSVFCCVQAPPTSRYCLPLLTSKIKGRTDSGAGFVVC
jgi:hypothetical protein